MKTKNKLVFSFFYWVKTLAEQQNESQTTATEPITEPATPPESPKPKMYKCCKCGKEVTASWEGEQTEKGFVCNRCIKFKCRTCEKEQSKASGAYEGFQCKACDEKEHLERLRLNAVANFTFENAQLFKKLLWAISDCVNEALFEIKNEGILIRQMDPSRVAMVDYCLSKRSFQEFHVHTEGFLLVNIEEVLKQMKHLSKETSIKAFVDGKDAKFIITLVDSRERERKIPMLEVEKEELPPEPKISYTAKVRAKAVEFCTDLEDLGNACEAVSFEADCEQFIVKGAGDYASAKNKYSSGKPDGEGVVIEVEGNGDNRSVYSLSYLKSMIRKDLSETVVFEWSKDMPLRITHVVDALTDSRVVSFMAPRIEVDE